MADLVPSFLDNRRRETPALLAALADGDFHAVDWLAQRMVGGGAMFGFDPITAFGRAIREHVAKRNKRQIAQVVREYRDYLECVQVRYAVPAATVRPVGSATLSRVESHASANGSIKVRVPRRALREPVRAKPESLKLVRQVRGA
jgi:hypothetical protein